MSPGSAAVPSTSTPAPSTPTRPSARPWTSAAARSNRAGSPCGSTLRPPSTTSRPTRAASSRSSGTCAGPPPRPPGPGAGAPAPAPAEAGPPRPHGFRVLLVEDNKDTLRYIAIVLGARGHEVTTAERLSDALQAAAGRDLDLVISDIELPDGT